MTQLDLLDVNYLVDMIIDSGAPASFAGDTVLKLLRIRKELLESAKSE